MKPSLEEIKEPFPMAGTRLRTRKYSNDITLIQGEVSGDFYIRVQPDSNVGDPETPAKWWKVEFK